MTFEEIVKKIKSAEKSTIIITILIIIVVILLIYNFIRMNNISKPKNTEQMATTQPLKSTEQNRMTLYHAHWCGACKHFRPEWEKFKQELPKQNLNTVSDEYECESNKDKCNAMKIMYFPTLILHKADGTDIHFPDNIPRTSEGIITFIRQNL